MIFSKKIMNLIFPKKRNLVVLFLLLFLFLSNNTFAQRNNPLNQGSNSGGRQGASNQKKLRKISKDSLLIFSYSIENPNQEFPFQDTILDTYFHHFDPARDRLLDYASLGYMGSPLFQQFYEPSFRKGFDVGLHQYDLYKIKVENLRFYNLKTAYSDFYFSQGAAQDDIQLKAKFSRNFSKNMNFTLDYHRISQFGTPESIAYFYPEQKARHTAFSGGMAYKNQSKTYQSFLAFSNNIHQQEDNGGITSDTVFNDQNGIFNSTLAIPVWLEDANTRHAESEISYTQYYIYNPKQWKENKKRKAADKARRKAAREAAEKAAALRDSIQNNLPSSPDSIISNLKDSINVDTIPAVTTDSIPISKTDSLNNITPDSTVITQDSIITTQDSIATTRPLIPTPFPNAPPPPPTSPEGRSYTILHQVLYKKGTYKFYDVTSDSDSTYWDNLFLDTRGIRHFLVTRKIENTFAISTFKPRKNRRGESKSQSDFLEVGIRHAFNWIDEEAADSTVNNLFLTGKWNFNPNERLKVETYAHLGLWDNAGDYRISGNLFFDLKKLGQLQLQGVNQLYSPNLLQQRFYISKRPAWTNDFNPTLETNLSATYALPQYGFQATGKYHLLNNYIYFDTLATPQQESAPVSIFQLILQQDFHVGKFHLDNVLVLQQTTNDALNLPSFFTKHSLYYQGKWFKRALQIKIGTDIRLNNSYFANTYNPLVGQFILQNQQKIDFFPAVDFHTSIKVKNFRFFVKWENLTRAIAGLAGSIDANKQFYQLASYPIQNNRLRFGLAWKFVN